MSASGLIFYFFILISSIFGRLKVEVKTFKNCDSHVNYSAKFNLTIKTVGDMQYVDGTFILKEDIDNNLQSNVSIETFIAKEYVYLFSINERKTCDSLHKYFGEYLYDLERNAQLIPKMCPIHKGTYHLHNAPLDVEKVPTLTSFPLGLLRFTDIMYTKNNQVYTCLVWVLDSRML